MNANSILKAFVLPIFVAGLFLLTQTAGRASATASLYLEQACTSNGTVTLKFSWDSNSSGANQQWVDVSSTSDWQAGTYAGAGPLGPEVQSYEWPGYKPGNSYYVRHNQQLASGVWDPTRNYSIVVQQCGSSISAQLPPVNNSQPVATTPSTAIRKASDFVGSTNPPTDFCTFAACIQDFWLGQGFVVMCVDGAYSKTGGVQGSCLLHGGQAGSVTNVNQPQIQPQQPIPNYSNPYVNPYVNPVPTVVPSVPYNPYPATAPFPGNPGAVQCNDGTYSVAGGADCGPHGGILS